jgi:hypothetical protein
VTPSWPHTLVLIVTFVVVIIAAGHSVAPVGLLLALGWNRDWLAPVVVGWMAIIVIILGRAWRNGHDLQALRAGGILSGCSWILFVFGSEARLLTVVLSLPFLASLATWLHRTWERGTASGG